MILFYVLDYLIFRVCAHLDESSSCLPSLWNAPLPTTYCTI